MVEAAQTIRLAVARVTAMRLKTHTNAPLLAATVAVKRFQARRFRATYADLFRSAEYAAATRFFLDELYSDKDFSLRDAQFARIAGALQRFFPASVVATAVAMAELHALTEELDLAMAEAWLADSDATAGADSLRYAMAWKRVDRPTDRECQLTAVLAVGTELDRLTRMPGLRMMLKMMRRPAHAAGLGSLQSFLEAGFDTFAAMSGKGSHAQQFLNLIEARETHWIEQLFADDVQTTQHLLANALASEANTTPQTR
jgi:hypothetical protein